jgi:hypothetical protein
MVYQKILGYLVLAFFGCFNNNGLGVTAKELVVFAGPHKTSETSVEEFFYSFAGSPDIKDSPEQQALKDWIWPQIIDDSLTFLPIGPYAIYQYLVTKADDDKVQQVLLQGIQDQFEMATKGIIIGNAEFDRVGASPYSHYDSIAAIQRVVDRLDITKEDVTIVLLYKTPRIDQWLGIFNFEVIEVTKGDYSYDEFVCDPTYSQHAWEYLDAAMNPLRAATLFREQGWKVKLIDLHGVKEAKIDVEHVIGCEVLGGDCHEGWLKNLKYITFEHDTVKDDEMTPAQEATFGGLTHSEQDDLDKLLLVRDCKYESLALDSGVTILYEYRIWETCKYAPLGAPERLTDTDFFLNAIQSQVDCNKHAVSILEILTGEVDADSSKTVESSPENTTSTKEDKHPSWRIPVFLLVFIGMGAGLLVWINKASHRQQYDNSCEMRYFSISPAGDDAVEE